MSNDNGSTPDDNADAAGEVLTEIGVAPNGARGSRVADCGLRAMLRATDTIELGSQSQIRRIGVRIRIRRVLR